MNALPHNLVCHHQLASFFFGNSFMNRNINHDAMLARYCFSVQFRLFLFLLGMIGTLSGNWIIGELNNRELKIYTNNVIIPFFFEKLLFLGFSWCQIWWGQQRMLKSFNSGVKFAPCIRSRVTNWAGNLAGGTTAPKSLKGISTPGKQKKLKGSENKWQIKKLIC